jgi:hypothetical protein
MPKRVWENNMKTDRREVGCEDVSWVVLAKDDNYEKNINHQQMNKVFFHQL